MSQTQPDSSQAALRLKLRQVLPPIDENIFIEAMHLIDQAVVAARIKQLEDLHRYDGRDYDNEMDEHIDDLIAQLQAEQEEK